MQEDTKGEKLRYENESFCIRGCIYEVNKKLGIGFLEAVYQEALEIELKKAEIPYERENPAKTNRITIAFFIFRSL
jgi:GxxExxY protein